MIKCISKKKKKEEEERRKKKNPSKLFKDKASNNDNTWAGADGRA